jgi:hypothetical protein
LRRRTIIVLSLAVVLAAVILVTVVQKNRPVLEPEYVDTGEEDHVAISHFDENLIQYMEVNSPRGTLRLQNQGEEWKVLDFPHPVKLKASKVEDLIYSFCRLYSEKIIEEEPSDLAQYGLVSPVATARYTLTDGSSREFYLGEQTPAGNMFYLTAQNDPKVYAVWMNHASHFQYTLEDIREEPSPVIELQKTTYLKILREGQSIMEIVHKEDLPQDVVTMEIAWLYMIEPYAEPRAISPEGEDRLWSLFGDFRISQYVEDTPVDLGKYGLDEPLAEYIHRDEENSRFIRFGRSEGEMTYIQLPGDPSVYAIKTEGNLDFLTAKPFDYIDKLAFIINIENVEQITIKGGGREHTLGIERKKDGDEEVSTFFFDGDERDEKVFKSFYKSLIGIQLDAEHSGGITEKPDVEIVFHLRNSPAEQYRATLVLYDNDFYALFINGISEFLVNRSQVNQLMEDLDRLGRGEKSLFM